MAVFHIVHKDDPRFAVRTVKNVRAAKTLLEYLGSDYMITEDLCSEFKISERADAFTERAREVSKQLRNGNADFM